MDDLPAPTIARLQERFGNAVVAQALAGGGEALGALIHQAASDEAAGKSSLAAARFESELQGAVPTAGQDPAEAVSADDETRIAQLRALLVAGCTEDQLEEAAGVADGLTPAGREALVGLDGGTPCARLQAFLEGQTFDEGPSSAAELGEAVSKVGAALPDVQTSGMNVDVDPLSGQATVQLASFHLAGPMGSAQVGSLTGTGGSARIDADLDGSVSAELEAATLSIRDLVVPAYATIPALSAVGLVVQLEVELMLDPSAFLLDQLAVVGSELVGSAATLLRDEPNLDPAGIGDALRSRLAGAVHGRVASLDLPQGALGPDGAPLVEAAHGSDLSLDAGIGDSLSLLRQERDALRAQADPSATDLARIEFIDAELVRLAPLAAERDALAARAVSLTEPERDRLRELDAELHTATVAATAGDLSAEGLNVAGVNADRLGGSELSLSASVQASPATGSSAGMEADALGDALAEHAGREVESEVPPMAVHLDAEQLEASGSASVKGVDLSGSGSAQGVSIDLSDTQVSATVDSATGEDLAAGAAGKGAGSIGAAGCSGLALEGDLEAGTGSLTAERVSASEVDGQLADGSSVSADQLAAGDLAVSGDLAGNGSLELGTASASGLEATQADGTSISADTLRARDLAVSGNTEQQELTVGSVRGADAEIALASGERVSVDQLSATGVSASSDAEQIGFAVDEADLTGVSASKEGMTVSVGAVAVDDLSGTRSDAESGLAIGSAEVRNARCDDGTNQATIDHLGAEGVAAHTDASGSTFTAEHGEVDGVTANRGDNLSLDHAEVGHVGVALDAENNVVGGCAEDLEAVGIHVELIGFDPNKFFGGSGEGEAAAPESAPSGDGPLQLETLDHASGQLRICIPVNFLGIREVVLRMTAEAGVVSMRDIDIDVTGAPIIGSIAQGIATLVENSAAFCMKIGSLMIRRVSGAPVELGVTTPLRSVVEAMANGYLTAEVEEEELEEGERDKVTEELGDAMTRRLEGTSFDGTRLTVGKGGASWDGVGGLTLAPRGGGVNRFTLSGTLGAELTLGANRIAASELHATVGDQTMAAEQIGLQGLSVSVGTPMADAHHIEVDVEGAQVASVTFGDTSKIAPRDHSPR